MDFDSSLTESNKINSSLNKQTEEISETIILSNHWLMKQDKVPPVIDSKAGRILLGDDLNPSAHKIHKPEKEWIHLESD